MLIISIIERINNTIHNQILHSPQMTPKEQKQFQSIAEKYRQKLYPPDYLD